MAAYVAMRDRKGPAVTWCAQGRRDSAGAATPVVIALIAVIVVLALAVVAGGAVMVAHAKVSAAADLSALAAARVDRDARAKGNSPDASLKRACAEARAVAALNGGTVTRCTRGAEWSVRVAVETRVSSWPHPLTAAARAGPSPG